MKNYLIFIVKLFLISFLSLQVNAKTLPPGTGGAADVPANVLILLDATPKWPNPFFNALNVKSGIKIISSI